jgi:hypothetical protein
MEKSLTETLDVALRVMPLLEALADAGLVSAHNHPLVLAQLGAVQVDKPEQIMALLTLAERYNVGTEVALGRVDRKRKITLSDSEVSDIQAEFLKCYRAGTAPFSSVWESVYAAWAQQLGDILDNMVAIDDESGDYQVDMEYVSAAHSASVRLAKAAAQSLAHAASGAGLRRGQVDVGSYGYHVTSDGVVSAFADVRVVAGGGVGTYEFVESTYVVAQERTV